MSILLFTRKGCLGNDVIDLTQVFHTQDLPGERLLKRVLSTEEYNLYEESSDKMKSFAIFWAAKESAFKAISYYFDVPFSWNEYIVNLKESTITFREHSLTYQIYFFQSCIHVIATGELNGNCISPAMIKDHLIYSQEHKQTDNESDAVREFTKSCLQSELPGEIHFSKDLIFGREIPSLYLNGKKKGLLSLSHHGMYHGFAYLKEYE